MNLFQNTGTWSYNVGGTRFPLRPVRMNKEAYAELLKSVHSFSDVSGSGLHTLAYWTGTGMPTNGVPSYILAQDFERYSHKSGTAESGLNVSNLQIYLECAFAALGRQRSVCGDYIYSYGLRDYHRPNGRTSRFEILAFLNLNALPALR